MESWANKRQMLQKWLYGYDLHILNLVFDVIEL